MIISSAITYDAVRSSLTLFFLPSALARCALIFHSPMDCMQPAGLLRPRDFPGKGAGLGCHALSPGIFPTHVSCTAGGFSTTEPPEKPQPWLSLQDTEQMQWQWSPWLSPGISKKALKFYR